MITTTVRTRILPNRYADSVSLMAASQELAALPGVAQAMITMGTPLNKEQLERVGLLTPEAAAAGPGDLIIAVAGAGAEAAVARAEALLTPARSGAAADTEAPPRTIRTAVKATPDATVALISVPGAYAALEARHALEAGLDVMLYSDNVPLEAEVALKQLAREKGLLLMGPDCGTAILDGVGLGFANAVRRGAIGIVAASGTGAQEVACLVHQLGAGISQIIGTGGRDLTAAVGGLMTLEGLRRLDADPATDVIVLVSKTPDPGAAGRIQTAPCRKPVVRCFLGGATSLDQAAAEAVAIATGRNPGDCEAALGYSHPLPVMPLRAGCRKVQGLFSGGTLCQQARQILTGAEHRLLDLGDDLYTVGRPHPMIDPTLRTQSLRAAAADPSTAVILIDVVLGHGAHPDPAGALAPAIREAVAQGVPVAASVTGVAEDPQGLEVQVARLTEAGARVFPTARLAALAVAAALASEGGCRR
ncbi:MAG TPA: succinyl-CoA synthetase subunit alpha [Symbiobacteriaceae bacterium]|nr:succinyl-CoA synthetase subunit alpha [Symbiobacteriaceae bacterium]